ncbi:MAG: hypothetical protein DU429_02235 [Candidatus Tokpelaia sp.]|nr:MAG: hypothetical protein DU429_02235 [Candidatus Tokpelaia sp.]
MRNILENGAFRGIDADFVDDCAKALRPLALVQQAYGKKDNERFIREWQHCIIAQYLNYDEVNHKKHGFAARARRRGRYDFLAIKSASLLAKSWHATFNDTTYAKAQLFKQDNIFLALAVWHGLDRLLFIAYGRNAAIGDFLAAGVRQHEARETVRSTQSIALADLVCCYGFKIYAVSDSPEAVYVLLQQREQGRKIPHGAIVPITDFLPPA